MYVLLYALSQKEKGTFSHCASIGSRIEAPATSIFSTARRDFTKQKMAGLTV